MQADERASETSDDKSASHPFDSMSMLRLVHLNNFEPSVSMAAEKRGAYDSRFVTLFADDKRTRRGGLGSVTPVINAHGETFALKVLTLPDETQLTDGEDEDDADASSQAYQRELLTKAFRQEYERHQTVSGIKGFPRLYGYGLVNDVPAIVMEWVEGISVAQAARQLALDDDGRLSPLTAACIGRDLFDLIARFDVIEGGFVHRDISPANIMICTKDHTLSEQVEAGEFDLRLIDFGSAAALAFNPSLTTRGLAPRGATPDFAPPEMLTNDISSLQQLRTSTAVDVYAAASVLYALLAGCPPFDLRGDHDGAPLSPYRRKTESTPLELVMVHEQASDIRAVLMRESQVALAVGKAVGNLEDAPSAKQVAEALSQVDDQLAFVIDACLSAQQNARPVPRDVRDALSNFVIHYEDNVCHALAGEPLEQPLSQKSYKSLRNGSNLRRARVRFISKGAAYALCAVIALGTGVLLHDVQLVAWFGIATSFHVPGMLITACLLIPAVCGLLARGKKNAASPRMRFVRATVALGIIAALFVVVIGGASVVPSGAQTGCLIALFAATATGWCPLVVDYTLRGSNNVASDEA
ncbi:protein kinase domain-containing protein [Adlercreutzia agrestimuris]|uniref:protein kinase domain-containing protein n=1 Tax=Adlercreutzia agrestimuris TaxID=2941324 RepID=UPI00203B95D4|nr:hypothetical protein [Adlercreutzia agrestimuris]